MLPQVNARIVSAAGSSGYQEDYGEPTGATDDEPRDSGLSPAYFSSRIIRSTATGELNLLEERTLVIDADLLEDELEPGDTITYRLDGEDADRQADIRDLRQVSVPGLPPALKVWLEDG